MAPGLVRAILSKFSDHDPMYTREVDPFIRLIIGSIIGSIIESIGSIESIGLIESIGSIIESIGSIIESIRSIESKLIVGTYVVNVVIQKYAQNCSS